MGRIPSRRLSASFVAIVAKNGKNQRLLCNPGKDFSPILPGGRGGGLRVPAWDRAPNSIDGSACVSSP